MQQQLIVLLFVAGEQGLSLQDLATLLNKDLASVRQQLANLTEKLQATDQYPLTIKQFGEQYQLLTKAKYHDLLDQYWQTEQANKLSSAALEVVAIIAYQQPVTRIEIDEIRGVKNSSATLQTLIVRQLIKVTGHKDAPGRPMMYGTTKEFLNYFGLTSLDDLPPLAAFQEQNLDQQGNVNLFSKKDKDE